MIHFFQTKDKEILAVGVTQKLTSEAIQRLLWLFGDASMMEEETLAGFFVGPRKEMITPWSTNAVEITRNMGIEGVERIESFWAVPEGSDFDPMLQAFYTGLNQDIFTIDASPQPIIHIENIAEYNKQEGLALSDEEVAYLNGVSEEIGRKLTDSEVFGFSQVNSEHCRHKIFNGIFVIDGKEKESSLFSLIKKTSKVNPNVLVSAYKDNVSFNKGPVIEQFAPSSHDKPDFFKTQNINSVLSLKAETHNFPTTVEPFNGAATGSGGEIRDRLAGGKASIPMAGTAVYMTAYPRLSGGRSWEKKFEARSWLYQSPEQILIKASNGASDFGNKFGQPLICGSVFTFEHFENAKRFAYDKVIMLAGGIGYGKYEDALKDTPDTSDRIILLGGDNYRIGMGGGAVSSVDTGEYDNAIELNAVQRANPEMQKRAANVIRAMSESDRNPIVSIHDHGAGGHLNSLSELVEDTGGRIDLSKLPVGDPTLSAKEIVGNESQERMGMVLKKKDVAWVKQIADRERSPMYDVGEVTGDMHFAFEGAEGERPIDLKLEHFFGKSPKTVIVDETQKEGFAVVNYDNGAVQKYIEELLQLEAVACKDWLTNKVDRSVTGKIAMQQTAGELQLPLNNVGVVSLDFRGEKGIATAIGHAPGAAIIDAAAGSVLAIAESLTNLVWAPCAEGMKSISLSANWMWPCKNPGEDARLYKAVEACSDFACALGINIPTGKDSLSMTQKYGEEKVFSPGTVIISAAAEVSNVRQVVSPVVKGDENTSLLYIDLSSDELHLGGSSFAQLVNCLGDEAPTVKDYDYFKNGFLAVQDLIKKGLVMAGHDISAGGLLTTLLEMNFANVKGGMSIDLSGLRGKDSVSKLFSENPGVVIQVKDLEAAQAVLREYGVSCSSIGVPTADRKLELYDGFQQWSFDIDCLRDAWYKTSYLLDRMQSGETLALKRFENYKKYPISYKLPEHFTGRFSDLGIEVNRTGRSGVTAAIIREKGSNGDREMAYALHLAGFDVKDVHTTDLTSGRETLEEVQMIIFVGGFSNSDVLGSAKGWAGSLLYNEKAKKALTGFYARENTLSLGICNGCQLMMELGLLYPDHDEKPKMTHNDSHKFESCFIELTIPENNSVMFSSLAGSQLGVWSAHGEGKFVLPKPESAYHIVGKYSYGEYPHNPNGSPFNTAAMCSEDGRHLAMMPHLERTIFPWQCGYYSCPDQDYTPWLEAFVNARKWLEGHVN